MIEYLRETVRNNDFDIIDSGLCHFVWKVCNCYVFDNIKSSDFIAFMNLHKDAIVPKIRNQKQGKMCYVIHELSVFLSRKTLEEQWINAMLSQLKISKSTYEHHRYINIKLANTSEPDKKFAEDINTAIKQIKEIGL